MKINNKDISSTNQRIFSPQYLAGSVKTGASSIIDAIDQVGTTTVTLPTASRLTNDYLVSLYSKDRVLAVHEVSVFVGSIAKVNQIPGGSAITHSDYLIYPPHVSLYKSSTFELAENYEQVIRTVVENNSGSDKTIIIVCRVKYIANRGGSGSAS